MGFERVEWNEMPPAKAVGLARRGGDGEACWEIRGLNSEPLTHSLDE